MSAKVKRWLKTYPSKETSRRYEFSFSKFCKFHKVTPEETLTWEVEEAEDRIIDWKNYLVEEGRAGSSIKVSFTAVKQWFLFNRKKIMVQCKNVSVTRTYFDYIPSREDVQRLLDTTKLHHRVIIALIAFSGLRPVDVASLQYKHIKKSFEDGDEVLTITKEHSKTKQWYPTFLGYQGTRYLRSYIQERKDKGEKIKPSSHIIVRMDKGRMGQTVGVPGVAAAVRRAIERTVGPHPTGEDFRLFRPYGLRKYFRRTVEQLGESVAEYLMGHKRGFESLAATYSGLRDLDPKAIDDLKQQYIRILPELETEVADSTLRTQIADLKVKEEVRKAEIMSVIADMEEKAEVWEAERASVIADLKVKEEVRKAELVYIKKDVDEIRDFLRQLKEQDLREQDEKSKKS